MTDALGHWGSELASIWTNYRPPSRPSNSERVIYTKYLRKVEKTSTSKPNLLILGSTSEFRDWGHEENLNVTVIDFSTGYNKTVWHQMKYKNIKERFVNLSWQEMSFVEEFDIIVGDLVIGNLREDEIIPFLQRVRNALKKNGYFMTKSFFRNEAHQIKTLDQIFLCYMREKPPYHPFPFLIYDIALYCMDKTTGILSFNHMYDLIVDQCKKGNIDEDVLMEFSILGWQRNMKFEFYIPTISQWESMIDSCLQVSAKEYGYDIYSQNFPIYIINRKKEE